MHLASMFKEALKLVIIAELNTKVQSEPNPGHGIVQVTNIWSGDIEFKLCQVDPQKL